ncbi:MAG: hypothetical protein ACRDD1_05465, partial [Planctomycetia bacterium]
MALRFWYRGPADEEWTELDVVADRVSRVVLQVGYAHPARLTWTMGAPQHTLPVPARSHVVFVDTDYADDFNLPVFEGWVHDVDPGRGSNEVRYTAYDPTKRAADELFILSGPTSASYTLPRLVYNAPDVDDDERYERGKPLALSSSSASSGSSGGGVEAEPAAVEYTVGEIIQDLLSDPYARLVELLAAPPPTVGGAAYIPADLAAMSYIPQEKVVFESETVTSGLQRLLSYYPQIRLSFVPGGFGRFWRFRDVKIAPTVTLTLNEVSEGARVVMSLALDRSVEGRYTAVRIFGPERHEAADETVSGGGLRALWTLQQELNFRQSGPGAPGGAVGWCGRRWQVAD